MNRRPLDRHWHDWPDPVGVDDHGIGVLDDPTCWRLLGATPIGRLWLGAHGVPTILPVNYVVRSHSILFASEFGAKLVAARRGDLACFEIDEFDVVAHRGWSVAATGRLSLVEPGELDWLEDLPLVPWALKGDLHLVRLGVDSVTGRVFGQR